MPKKQIARKGLQHVSKPLKKVMDRAVRKKADRMEDKIRIKENRLRQDSPYISNKTYNKDSKEISEMKQELLRFKVKYNVKG
tara:strand:- start:2185 stop:2430 length:246 start_codon:yes stop_codon:yes gene_type:complete